MLTIWVEKKFDEHSLWMAAHSCSWQPYKDVAYLESDPSRLFMKGCQMPSLMLPPYLIFSAETKSIREKKSTK